MMDNPMKPSTPPRPSAAAQLAALGGQPLAGSGFEEETPETGFAESFITESIGTETGVIETSVSGLALPQHPV